MQNNSCKLAVNAIAPILAAIVLAAEEDPQVQYIFRNLVEF